MMSEENHGFVTKAVHAGEGPDPATGALATPLYQSTAFAFSTAEEAAAVFAGERPGYVYTRWGNPTVAALERKVAALEGGEAALATASGMAAVSTAMLGLVKTGDHIVSADSVYSGTYGLFARRFPEIGIEVTFVDATDPINIERALRPATKVIYLESPGNPTLKVTDLQAVAALAKEAGLTTAIDNTFATPYNQQPIARGIDVVIHSATKYLCGHGDAIGGVLVGRAEFIERTQKNVARVYGGVMSPFNAWLILRGMVTLPLRVAQQNANALKVAHFLEGYRQVKWVIYPGLESHPQHELARRQMRGFGGMVCFELKGGVEAGRRFLNRLKLCTLAVSLGDVRTLICHPASMTHASVPREARLVSGITDGLVRLSVGIEEAEDIISDLAQALEG